MAPVKQAVSDHTAALLRKVIQRILAEPLAFNMDSWERFWRQGYQEIGQMDADGNPYERNEDAPACGTTCCIAGHVILSSNEAMETLKAKNAIKFLRGTEKFEVNFHFLDGPPEVVAAELLDIALHDAHRLFYLPDQGYRANWPEEFAHRYRTTPDAAGRAKIAAERIEHFIQTGE